MQDYNIIEKYNVKLKLTQPLHVGDGNEEGAVLVHPVDNTPFLQAASISGLFRDVCPQKLQAEYYGASKENDGVNRNSIIAVTDARIYREDNRPLIETRPHVRISPNTGTVSESDVKGINRKSGQKFNLEYIGAGAFMDFEIRVYCTEEEREDIDEHLLETYRLIHHKQIQFGGKKSYGCGEASIVSVSKITFDMKSEEDRFLWSANKSKTGVDITEDVIRGAYKSALHKIKYCIYITAKTESTILVKGATVKGDYDNLLKSIPEEKRRDPDEENARDINGDLIIPGSSFKGTVRSRIEKIAEYMFNDQGANIVEDLFGKTSSGNTPGYLGVMRFKDTIIKKNDSKDKNKISYRIHIDKWTGGVMNRALFSTADTYSDKLEMEIDILKSSKENLSEKALLLSLLALRDIALNIYNIGSGYGIGKGFFEDVRVKIVNDKKQEASIDFNNNVIADADGIIAECYKSFS